MVAAACGGLLLAALAGCKVDSVNPITPPDGTNTSSTINNRPITNIEMAQDNPDIRNSANSRGQFRDGPPL